MRMLVSRQTAMKFIQEGNIGPRIHSFPCLTGKISVLLSELFEIKYLLSHFKDNLYKFFKKWYNGETATILGESSDCD